MFVLILNTKIAINDIKALREASTWALACLCGGRVKIHKFIETYRCK